MSPKDDEGDKWKRDVEKSSFSRNASSGKFDKDTSKDSKPAKANKNGDDDAKKHKG